jgi:hypothetical protein
MIPPEPSNRQGAVAPDLTESELAALAKLALVGVEALSDGDVQLRQRLEVTTYEVAEGTAAVRHILRSLISASRSAA